MLHRRELLAACLLVLGLGLGLRAGGAVDPRPHVRRQASTQAPTEADDDDWPNYWDEPSTTTTTTTERIPLNEPVKEFRGKVLMAQDEYMLVYVKGRGDCSLVHFQEEMEDSSPGHIKMCEPTEERFLHWVYPFIPGKLHTLNVYCSTSRKLLFTQTIQSLPMYPPRPANVTVSGGAGWLLVAFEAVRESAPSLVGYRVGYRALEEGAPWRYVVSKHVVYTHAMPYVRPVHPCRAFRVDRTFCVLLTDHVRLRHLGDHRLFNISIQPFRVVPERDEELYPDNFYWTTFNLTACDWLARGSCPPLGARPHRRNHNHSHGGSQERSRRSASDHGSAKVNDKEDDVLEQFSRLPFAVRQKISADSAEEVSERLRRRQKQEVAQRLSWLALLIAVLTCLFLGSPAAHFCGRRWGRKKAQSKWTQLTTRAEKVALANQLRDEQQKPRRKRVWLRLGLGRFRRASEPQPPQLLSMASACLTAATLGRKRPSSVDLDSGEERDAHWRSASLPVPLRLCARDGAPSPFALATGDASPRPADAPRRDDAPGAGPRPSAPAATPRTD